MPAEEEEEEGGVGDEASVECQLCGCEYLVQSIEVEDERKSGGWWGGVCIFFLSFARALYITETARGEGMKAWEGGRCGVAIRV